MAGHRRATPGKPTQQAGRAERRQQRLNARLSSARTPGERLAAVYDYAREVIAVLDRDEPSRADRLASDLTHQIRTAATAADPYARR